MQDNVADHKQDPEPVQDNEADHKQDPEPVQDNVTGSQPGPEPGQVLGPEASKVYQPGQVSYPEPNISCYILLNRKFWPLNSMDCESFSKKEDPLDSAGYRIIHGDF